MFRHVVLGFAVLLLASRALATDEERLPVRKMLPDDPAAQAALRTAGATWNGNKNRVTKLFSVSELQFNRKPVNAELLAHIAKLPNCKQVRLIQTPVSDDAFASLAQAKHLDTLFLQSTGLTNEGLRAIAGLELRTLHATKAKVTDDGLAPLAKVQTLESLKLAATPITDRGLATISKLSNLRVLDVSYTDVGDAGVEHIAKLTKLTKLTIGRTDITFAGLKPLSSCDKLEDTVPNIL